MFAMCVGSINDSHNERQTTNDGSCRESNEKARNENRGEHIQHLHGIDKDFVHGDRCW